MEREQYELMSRREDQHWWYTGMRRVALAILRRALAGTPAPRILDAGCGTGGTTIRLHAFGGTVFGVDLANEALQPAATRGLAGKLAQGSVERLPFRDASFDAVTSFEVVYHAGVQNDAAALREFRRVLRPGGLLLLRLPGHDWLRGQHDRLVHTRHRYSRAEVDGKLQAAGFRVEFLSWANSLLFPPAVAKRLLERAPRPNSGRAELDASAEPDLWQPPAWLNQLLERCVTAEAAALERRMRLPFGLSVLALARAA
jgi:SAM-dependent methyltransferase